MSFKTFGFSQEKRNLDMFSTSFMCLTEKLAFRVLRILLMFRLLQEESWRGEVMGILECKRLESSLERLRISCTSMSSEASRTVLGAKRLIKKLEFVRVIIQCLYSLGFGESASCLELESGISNKSLDFELLKSQILAGNWDGCIQSLRAFKELVDDTRALALFLIFKQCILEYLSRGDYSLALTVLRKEVSALEVGSDKVHKLAHSILSLEEEDLGKNDDSFVLGLRKKLLRELENLLPPPIVVPEKRLEHLVETTVLAQIHSCVYHNSPDLVSLCVDHSCGRDQIPTETIQILTEHQNEVWFVQFSSSGKYLASSSSDCTAIIWEVPEDEKITPKHKLLSHQKPVSFVAWSPDDTKLLTCGNMEVLKLWDVETGTLKHTFGDHSFIVGSCAWFPDSERLVCGSSDPEKGICLWDCDGKEIKAWRGMRMPKVLDLAVTPDGENLICIFSDKEIRILNVGTNSDRVILEEHSITSLSLSGDGEFFIVNLNSQEIHMWDVAGKWEKPMKYTGHKQSKYVIRSCFGGFDSKFIASGSENTQVYIWNRGNFRPIEVLSGHSMTVNCVSWNPRRPRMLASASDDHTIRIWGPSLPDYMQSQKLS